MNTYTDALGVRAIDPKTVFVNAYWAVHDGHPRFHREYWRRPPQRYGLR